MFLASLNAVYIKYAIIAVTFPLWMPFLRALYAELNEALAEEGGLFGRKPTPAEMVYIVNDPNRIQSPLVSKEFEDEHPRPAKSRAASSSGPAAPKQRKEGLGSIGFSKSRGVRGFARKDQRAD